MKTTKRKWIIVLEAMCFLTQNVFNFQYFQEAEAFFEGGYIYLGEGNGNPLQYACLESPVDREAWWAAVQGVTQSQSLVKRLSMHAWIGEGNGNPLQCSCLENPRDGGAWWAAVYGVAQSQIRLKRLSSSSSSISTNPCTSLKGEIVKQRFILCNYSLIAILIACTLSSCKVNGQILYLVVKNLPVKAGDSGDAGLIPRWGTIPRRRKWQPIPIPKYSCLGNPMDREAWQAIVHGVAKSWTQLSSWAHILVSTSHKPFWPCSSYYRMMVAYFFINIQVITRWNVNDFRIPKVVVWGKKLIFKPWTNQTQVKTIILNL